MSKVLYSYDNFFRPARKAISASYFSRDVIVKTAYDRDGRSLQIGDISYVYDSVSGRPTGASIGNIHDQWSYNAFGEVAAYQSSLVLGSSVPLYSYILERDLAGHITQKTETVLQKTNVYNYAYDAAGRLGRYGKMELLLVSMNMMETEIVYLV